MSLTKVCHISFSNFIEVSSIFNIKIKNKKEQKRKEKSLKSGAWLKLNTNVKNNSESKPWLSTIEKC